MGPEDTQHIPHTGTRGHTTHPLHWDQRTHNTFLTLGPEDTQHIPYTGTRGHTTHPSHWDQRTHNTSLTLGPCCGEHRLFTHAHWGWSPRVWRIVVDRCWLCNKVCCTRKDVIKCDSPTYFYFVGSCFCKNTTGLSGVVGRMAVSRVSPATPTTDNGAAEKHGNAATATSGGTATAEGRRSQTDGGAYHRR